MNTSFFKYLISTIFSKNRIQAKPYNLLQGKNNKCDTDIHTIELIIVMNKNYLTLSRIS